MGRRSLRASFIPWAYVFPGGAVAAAGASHDHPSLCDESAQELARRVGVVTEVGDQALGFAVAALRECFEECGLWLGAPDHHAPEGGGFEALRARLHAGESLATLVAASGTRLITSGLQPWSRWVTPVGLPKRFDTLFFVARTPVGQVPEVDAGETTTLAWVNPPTALEMREKGEFPMEFATASTLESLRPFASAQPLLGHAGARPRVWPPPRAPRPGCRAFPRPGRSALRAGFGACCCPARPATARRMGRT